jgi:hypothetical protein
VLLIADWGGGPVGQLPGVRGEVGGMQLRFNLSAANTRFLVGYAQQAQAFVFVHASRGTSDRHGWCARRIPHGYGKG